MVVHREGHKFIQGARRVPEPVGHLLVHLKERSLVGQLVVKTWWARPGGPDTVGHLVVGQLVVHLLQEKKIKICTVV